MMSMDRYTKVVLTVIAAALVVLALNPWLARVEWRTPRVIGQAEAQTPPSQTPPAPPAPAAPPGPAPSPAPAPAPAAPGMPARPMGQIPQVPPGSLANFQWWDECTSVSKETVPASWGKLVDLAPGAFVFESDDMIRLVRTAPYESVPLGPNGKPCKMLEIKKTK